MNRRRNEDEMADELLDMDLGSYDPLITQRVLAAVSKSDDPHLHIDILRRALYKHAGKMQEQGKLLTSQKNEIAFLKDKIKELEKNQLDDSDIWEVVQTRTNKKVIGWVTWGKRLVAAAALAGLLKLAWKGLQSMLK